LYYPYTKKTTVKKNGKDSVERNKRTHNEDRKDMIKRFGKDRFEKLVQTDSHYKMYREPEIPVGFRWLFARFMDIRNNCEYDFNGNVIFTCRTILDYEECMGVTFSLFERRIILKMRDWSNSVVYELSKD